MMMVIRRMTVIKSKDKKRMMVVIRRITKRKIKRKRIKNRMIILMI